MRSVLLRLRIASLRYHSRMRFSLCLLALESLAACAAPPLSTSDASDTPLPLADAADLAAAPDVTDAADAPDPHDGQRLPRCEDTEPGGAPTFTPVASTLLGSIEPMAGLPIAQPDLSLNPVFERGELAYRARNFHEYVRGPAQTRLRRADLGDPAAALGTRASLAYFVHLSDTQLVDDESPTRLANLDTPTASGAIRPQEGWLPYAMSAMHRTLAALQRTQRPFQFGIIAGDCADSAQQNELNWFMNILNGQRVELDSGADDDPVTGPGNDPKDPIMPTAFPAPWYFVPGNHDLEVVGVSAVAVGNRDQALGTYAGTGTRNYTRWWAEPFRGTVVPDPTRTLLDRATIVQSLLTGPAAPGPAGHGFAVGMDVSVGANYVADVVPGLLRILALDSSDLSGGSQGMVHQATIDQWLLPQLARAEADGVLVMLASHHATTDIDRNQGQFGPVVADAVDGPAIEQLVAAHPVVIAWLVGHNHDVRIRAVRGPDAAHPGYWEIQSGSIADFPNQSRVIEVVFNGNGTLSIFGTMIDYEPTGCLERRFRRLALIDYMAAWESNHRGTDADRNVELVVPVPAAAMAAVNTIAASAPARIESETTLRGMP